MATIQPGAGDKMNNPSHSFLHRVIASDAVAPEQSFVVDASGNVSIKENKKYQINGNNLSTSDLVIATDHQYVTDSEKAVLEHTSGVNTGDMSDLDVKTAYEANADTNAYTDANKTKLEGIETGAEVNNISDVNAVDLTDSGNSSLHYHSADRARANHTGTQLASTISDFDTEVANNSAVTANTAKITNAIHTGEVTGDEALTIANNVVDEANLKLDETPTNGYVLTADDSKSGGMKWAEASGGMSSGIYDPVGVTEQLVGLTAIQTLTNKTFTSPKINENVILNATSTELNLLSGLTVLSGENTGDQDLSGLALKSNVLELDNITPFTPDADYEPATKKYVDDNAGGSPEGTAIKSTGETGAVKFLREDGDGTCSWQVPAGGGDVSKKDIQEVSKEGLVLGMNFNSENITGSAGSETVLDSSGYNNHGTNHGATHDPDGGFNGGGAFDFDGVDDYIEFIETGDLTIFTVNLWVNFNSFPTGRMGLIGSTPANDNYVGTYSDTQMSVEFKDGTAISAIDLTFKNGWNMLTYVYDGSQFFWYKQGILLKINNIAGKNMSFKNIGNAYGVDFFDGSIDNVQIYNRALSADEIKALYLQRAEVKNSYVSQKDVFVDSSGNVGIDTDSPNEKLEVNGNIGADNFKTNKTTNHTVFVGNDAGGTGNYTTFVGEHAGENNTKTYSNALGYNALRNNTGAKSNAVGYFALYHNAGADSNALGYRALQNNTGDNSSALGSYALYYNTGDYSNALGGYALQNNTGNNSNALGYNALFHNTGDNSNALGYNALSDNNGNRNTAIGDNSFNTWTADTGNAKTVESVDYANNQVTITGHGFTGSINLKATTTGTLPAGLSLGAQQWKVIDANTLECKTSSFADAGTGTLTLTPSITYTNSGAFGYNAEPDASNQIVLGDTNVTQIKTAGAIYSSGSGNSYFGGNVGVGTDSPEASLDIHYDGDNGILLKRKDYESGYLRLGWNSQYNFTEILTEYNRLDIGTKNVQYGQLFLQAAVTIPAGAFYVGRAGDSTSTATQKGSRALAMQSNLYDNAPWQLRYSGFKTVTSTTIDMRERLDMIVTATHYTLSDGVTVMSLENTGNVGIGTTNPTTKLHNTGAYTQEALSADPADPPINSSVQWVSDGTGSYDAGDVVMKINVGGVTKMILLVDFSLL